MGDDLPRFPTPGETFGTGQNIPQRVASGPPAMSHSYPGEDYFNGVPQPPRPRYASSNGQAPPAPYPPSNGPSLYGSPTPPPQQYPPQGAPQHHQQHRHHHQSAPAPAPPFTGQPFGQPVSAPPGASGPGSYPGGGRAQVPINTPESNLRSLFNDVDRNRNGYLTESELASALVNGDYTRFNRETVRLMIRMFDRNGDGAIDFEEFGQLWRYLHEWRNIFDRFDRDRSGSINLREFSTALTAFGYNLSPRCVEYVFSVYAKRDRAGVTSMSFDMFVQSCIHLKSVTESFKKYDTDRDGYVTLAFEQFLVEVSRLR